MSSVTEANNKIARLAQQLFMMQNMAFKMKERAKQEGAQQQRASTNQPSKGSEADEKPPATSAEAPAVEPKFILPPFDALRDEVVRIQREVCCDIKPVWNLAA
jgi:hypothetical protein